MKNILLMFFLFLNTFALAQNIDKKKIGIISQILCDNLIQNKQNSLEERINESGFILSEGLSVIKSDSLKQIYAQKCDTYLQKNCLEYIKLLIHQTNADISVEEKLIEGKNRIVEDGSLLQSKEYYYRDFIGDTLKIKISGNILTESSLLLNTQTEFFLFEENGKKYLKFLRSSDTFFNDYYISDEIVEYKLHKKSNGTYDLFLFFENGITLVKHLNEYPMARICNTN